MMLARSTQLARRLPLRQSLRLAVARFSSPSERAPPEDYINGHLLTEHLEFVEDMIQKVDELEQTTSRLKKAYTVKWMDPADLEALFHVSKQTSQELAAQAERIRLLVEDGKHFFAVDAPDGETDGDMEDAQHEIDHMIQESAEIQRIRHEEGLDKIYAVDAPDGETDGHVLEEIKEVKHIIEK